jgi:hypothetical protein
MQRYNDRPHRGGCNAFSARTLSTSKQNTAAKERLSSPGLTVFYTAFASPLSFHFARRHQV